MSLLITEFINIFRNEIFSFQCTSHNVMVPFCKLTGRFKSGHSSYYKKIYWEFNILLLCIDISINPKQQT
jgi:hypothetical protein